MKRFLWNTLPWHQYFCLTEVCRCNGQRKDTNLRKIIILPPKNDDRLYGINPKWPLSLFLLSLNLPAHWNRHHKRTQSWLLWKKSLYLSRATTWECQTTLRCPRRCTCPLADRGAGKRGRSMWRSRDSISASRIISRRLRTRRLAFLLAGKHLLLSFIFSYVSCFISPGL